jgi:hypothetical protein
LRRCGFPEAATTGKLRAVTAIEVPEAPAEKSRRRRWAFRAAVATVVLVPLGWSAWWLLASTPIDGGAGFGIGMGDVEPGEVHSVGVAQFCLDGAGEATIDDVTVEPAGLTVVDFAVRPRPEPPALAFGAGGGPLREIATGWSRSFTAQCDDGDYAEVAVDLRRGVNGPAHTDAVDVHWSSGVRSGVLTLPVQVTMCAPDQADELC